MLEAGLCRRHKDPNDPTVKQRMKLSSDSNKPCGSYWRIYALDMHLEDHTKIDCKVADDETESFISKQKPDNDGKKCCCSTREDKNSAAVSISLVPVDSSSNAGEHIGRISSVGPTLSM